MTLFVLESGLSKASEAAKKWFDRPYLPFFHFFVKKNNNGTYTFINADDKTDIYITSTVKDVVRADNGYTKITTQNSVINITPACCYTFEYGVESFVRDLYCIIDTFNIKGEEFDPDAIDCFPIGRCDISGGTGGEWIDNTIYLYKTEEGIIIEENCWRSENNNETYSEKMTFYPIKIGGEIRKTERINVSFATD
jgi:hypothetical protein